MRSNAPAGSSARHVARQPSLVRALKLPPIWGSPPMSTRRRRCAPTDAGDDPARGPGAEQIGGHGGSAPRARSAPGPRRTASRPRRGRRPAARAWHPTAAGHRHLGEGDEQAAVGKVVTGTRRGRARSGRGRNRRCGARRRDRPAAARRPRALDLAQIQRAPSQPCASPIRTSVMPLPPARDRPARSGSSISPTPPITGASAGSRCRRLVVERHVARDDRVVERPAGLAPCLRCSRRTRP